MQTTARHQLTQGQMQTLQLDEDCTLTCLSGSIELQSPALPGLAAYGGYSLRLHTGQSWRAPGVVWVQLQSLGPAAKVELHITQAQEKCPSLESMGDGAHKPELTVLTVLAYGRFTFARLWASLAIKRWQRAI